MLHIPLPGDLVPLLELVVHVSHPILTKETQAPTLLVGPTGMPFPGSYSAHWQEVMGPRMAGLAFPPQLLRHIFIEGES